MLLGSAVTMAVMSSSHPSSRGVADGKFFGLLAYISAPAWWRSSADVKAVRASFFAAALLVFAYIVTVTLSHPRRSRLPRLERLDRDRVVPQWRAWGLLAGPVRHQALEAWQ